LQAAGVTNSWVFFSSIFATPLVGWIADQVGQPIKMLAAGMLAASAVHGQDGLLSENGRTAFAFPNSQRRRRLADGFCLMVRGASCNCSPGAQ